MKQRTLELLAVAVGGLLLVVGLYLAVKGELVDIPGAVTASATLVAAFLGAYFAFLLNDRREADRRHRNEKAALNRSLFILARQANAVENYRHLMVGYPSAEERALRMPAFKPPSYADLAHDFDGLAFLLETQDAQLLMDLSVEQERFEQVVEAIRVRNEFYVNEVQPAIISHGLTGRVLKFEEVSAALGERLVGGAFDGAAAVYEHVVKTSESLPKMITRLRVAAEELFPGSKFVSWDRVND